MTPSELMKLTIGEMESKYGIDKHRDETKEQYAKRVAKELKKQSKVAESVPNHRADTPKAPIKSKSHQPEVEVHKDREDLLRHQGYSIPCGVTVTFPSDDTWQIDYRGRQDSGHISADLQQAINQIVK